jgi:hypothetical protein
MVDRLCIVDPFFLDGEEDWQGDEHMERVEYLGWLCAKRKLQYLAYNCDNFIYHRLIFAELMEDAVWLQEIILFENTVPEDKCRVGISFKNHCGKCSHTQDACSCQVQAWESVESAIEVLWKKQDEESNEKATVRVCSLA